jgi:hypothetical protein
MTVIWLDCRRRAEWARIRGVEGRRQRFALVFGVTCRLGAFSCPCPRAASRDPVPSSWTPFHYLIHLGLYQLGIQVGHDLLRDD